MARGGLAAMDTGEGLALFDASSAARPPPRRPGPPRHRGPARRRGRGAPARPCCARWCGRPARRTVRPAARPAAGAWAQRRRRTGRGRTGGAVAAFVRTHAAAVLGHAVARPRSTTGGQFKTLGFDSLASVELRNRLDSATGLRLPATVVFDYPTPQAVVAYLLGRAGDDTAAGRAAPAAPGAALRSGDDPIAIVGMGCRYPAACPPRRTCGSWSPPAGTRSAAFPADRGWDLDDLYDPDPDRSGRRYVRRAAFLYDADGFDAEFFGISPREALAMDPQQRLLLETAWEAFERAGIDPDVAARQPDRRVRRRHVPGLRSPVRRARDGVEGYLLHRQRRPASRPAASRTRSGLEGPGGHGGHGVLVVAGRAASGGAGAARAGSARWRWPAA